MSEREHAILSPSFLHIALLCPAAVGLKESLPPEPAGAAALKGTIIHDAGAEALEDYLTHKVEGSDPDVRISKVTDAEVKKAALAWRDTIWERAFEKSVTGKYYGIEERLTFSEKFSLWGTTDFWLVSTDERAKRYGLICDLKTGFVYVDENKNPQLAAYAVSLRKTVRDQGKDLAYVKAAIYQPFAEGEKYRETTFTGKQLDVWEKKFLKLAETVYGGNAKFKAGDHCQYCNCKARCLEYDKYRTKQTGLRLLEPEEFQFPQVATIPDDVLVRIVKHEKQLSSFVKACRKELTNKLMSGGKLDGVKLVRAATKRKIDESQLKPLEQMLYNHQINLYDMVPKGITKLKEELGVRVPKKETEALLKPFLIQPPGGIVLAGADDEREEVIPGQGLFIAEEE